MPFQGFPKSSIKVGVTLERSAFSSVRMVELLIAVVAVFLLFSGMSFVFLRPALQEHRASIHSQWNDFLNEVKERNDMLPGLLETVKLFQPFFAKTAVKMLEAKAVIKRSREPEVIIASVDQLDEGIKTLESLVNSNPEMLQNSSFRGQWDLFLKKNKKVAMTRLLYNTHAQRYNDLLEIFPQSIFASLLGYVRAVPYPIPSSVAE